MKFYGNRASSKGLIKYDTQESFYRQIEYPFPNILFIHTLTETSDSYRYCDGILYFICYYFLFRVIEIFKKQSKTINFVQILILINEIKNLLEVKTKDFQSKIEFSFSCFSFHVEFFAFIDVFTARIALHIKPKKANQIKILIPFQ